MRIEIENLSEPALEFGGGLCGVNPKETLPKAGPFWAGSASGEMPTVALGLVAPESEVSMIYAWFERMRRLLIENESNALRYPPFPGVERTLRVRFEFDPRHLILLPTKDYAMAMARNASNQRFEAILEIYEGCIRSLCTDQAPRCILVHFPEEVATFSIHNPALTFEERTRLQGLHAAERQSQLDLFDDPGERAKAGEEVIQADELLTRYFHRALKARCMGVPNAVPTQIIRRQTYDSSVASQSEATRAWNLSIALLYKCGFIPWRPAELDEKTCFAGISFHHLKKRGGSMLYSSVAHAFSNAVEPFILRGAPIPHQQTRDKQPYLLPDQAAAIADLIVEGYKVRTGDYPKRLVIHKSSRFVAEEDEGFRGAVSGKVPDLSLVWLRSTDFRLLRRGMQEPLRGTLCHIGGQGRRFLFTTGYVPWWEMYPGPHIPAPLEIGADEPAARASEILALSKMNWNTADGIGRMPITLAFARRVGMIMTELEEEAKPNPSYRFYM